MWDSPYFGKLEDASKDRGSSWITATSMSCKNSLFLFAFLFLQVALISKSMGIKTPAKDLLYMQNGSYQFQRTMNYAVTKSSQNKQWIKKISTCNLN